MGTGVKTMNIRPRVLGWFERHPGEVATRERIAADLGLEARQVQQCIAVLRREGGADLIKVIAHGNAWQYTPPATSNGAAVPAPRSEPAKPSQAMAVASAAYFEQVGVNGKGAPIVKGEDGRMWTLVPL